MIGYVQMPLWDDYRVTIDVNQSSYMPAYDLQIGKLNTMIGHCSILQYLTASDVATISTIRREY